MNQIETFNAKTLSFIDNSVPNTSYYESIRAGKRHVLFIAGRLYFIGEFGRVSVSRLLNGILDRDVFRNVSMLSITIRCDYTQRETNSKYIHTGYNMIHRNLRRVSSIEIISTVLQ